MALNRKKRYSDLEPSVSIGFSGDRGICPLPGTVGSQKRICPKKEIAMAEIASAVLILFGCLFCLLAAVGMLRLPDTLIRMHAATKAGPLGAGLILASTALYFTEVGIILRALLTVVFIYLSAPVAAHLIGRAAYRSGILLYSGTWVDHMGEDMHTNPATPNMCPETDPKGPGVES